MKYQIGQTIKSIDFFTRVDCYMVGIIESIDETRESLKLKTLQFVSEGVELEVNEGDTFQTYYSPDMFDKHYVEPRLQIVEG